MKFIPIGSLNKTLTQRSTERSTQRRYTDLLKGSNYGHKAIK